MTKYLTFTVYIVSNQLIFEKEHLNLKCYWDEKIVYLILILLNYNYEISKKAVLGFSISYLVLEIFRFLILWKLDLVWRHSLT